MREAASMRCLRYLKDEGEAIDSSRLLPAFCILMFPVGKAQLGDDRALHEVRDRSRGSLQGRVRTREQFYSGSKPGWIRKKSIRGEPATCWQPPTDLVQVALQLRSVTDEDHRELYAT